MNERTRASLELVYIALENLLLGVDERGALNPSYDLLLALAADMKGSITEYWQSLDYDASDVDDFDF